MAAAAIADDGAIVIVHQHGCDHVGVDSFQTTRVLVGIAANPNVAGTLLLGLGCETIQGRPLQGELLALDRNVRYLEIQGCGGSASAVEAGRVETAALVAAASKVKRRPTSVTELTIGLATGAEVPVALVEAIAERLLGSGASLIVALSQSTPELYGAFASAARVQYGSEPPRGLAVTVGPSALAEQHSALAASGAQVLVSVCPAGWAPIGSPICPVIAVATDGETFAALRDDFDIDGSAGGPDDIAEAVVTFATKVFNGELTAAERRGAREFGLQRLIRST
jgi:altronate dehydratase large subunit